MEKRRGEGVSHFSVKNFWSKCQKFSYGNPLVRHCFRVSKNFMLKRVMSRCNVEIFLSHSTEKSLLQHVGVGKLRASKKLLAKGGSHFLSTIFCLTVPKKNVGTIRCIGKLRVPKKLSAKGDHYFLSKIFYLTGPKLFVREPFFV